MPRLDTSAVLSATALLVACSAETKVGHEPRGTGGEGGEITASSSAVGGTGGTGVGAQGGGGDGAGGEGAGVSTSGVGELRIVHEPAATAILGAFSQEPFPYCVIQASEGGCSFVICDYDVPAPPLLDAGPITISGATEPIVVPFDPAFDSYLYEADQAVVAPGLTLSVDVAGSSDVPALSGAVEVPSIAQLTVPDLSNASIDLTQPLDLAWTAGGAVGEVEVRVVTPGPAMENAYALLCRYAVGAGTATIPTSMLAHLVPTADEGSIGATLFETVELVAGGWTLEVSAGAWLTSASATNGYAIAQDIAIQ